MSAAAGGTCGAIEALLSRLVWMPSTAEKRASSLAAPDTIKPPSTSGANAATRRRQRDEELVNRVLYLIIAVLLFLVIRDFRQVASMNRRVRENEIYVKAVRSTREGWVTGWKLEELQSKLATQKAVLKSLSAALPARFLSFFGSLRGNGHSVGSNQAAAVISDLRNHIENVTAMQTWTCVNRPNSLIRVGQFDFFDRAAENCLLHSADSAFVSPNSIFEVVDLGEGYIGLRSFANGKYIKMTPPSSGKSSDPWSLDVASPVAGLAERFRVEGRMLYNELLQGHLKCAGSTQAMTVPIHGLPGTKANDLQYKPDHHFQFRQLTAEELEQARVFKAAASMLQRKSQLQVASFQESAKIKLQYEMITAKERLEQDGAKIAILIPITSKATSMYSPSDSPFFKNTLQSFLKTIDWNTNKFSFTFCLGFDHGDPVYDTGDAWSEMRQAFAENIDAYMMEAVSDLSIRDRAIKRTSLTLRHFRGMEGSPSQVVSELAQDAYSTGHDYLFQVNDDSNFQTKGWADIFTATLAESPLYVNLGVTGPTDINNPRILTHAFVHRTHLEIHDQRFFPKAFRNWWSDDWISSVYGRYGTFRAHSIAVLHDIHAQKQGSTVQRYKVDEEAQRKLRAEVLSSMVKVNAFLVSKGRPRLPLPSVCGYTPLVEEVYSYLASKAEMTTADIERELAHSRVKEANMVSYEIQKHPPSEREEGKGQRDTGGQPTGGQEESIWDQDDGYFADVAW